MYSSFYVQKLDQGVAVYSLYICMYRKRLKCHCYLYFELSNLSESLDDPLSVYKSLPRGVHYRTVRGHKSVWG